MNNNLIIYIILKLIHFATVLRFKIIIETIRSLPIEWCPNNYMISSGRIKMRNVVIINIPNMASISPASL